MNTMDDEMGSKEGESVKRGTSGMEFQLDSRFMPSTPNVYLSLAKRLETEGKEHSGVEAR